MHALGGKHEFFKEHSRQLLGRTYVKHAFCQLKDFGFCLCQLPAHVFLQARKIFLADSNACFLHGPQHRSKVAFNLRYLMRKHAVSLKLLNDS